MRFHKKEEPLKNAEEDEEGWSAECDKVSTWN
jgi:hypothetical protein